MTGAESLPHYSKIFAFQAGRKEEMLVFHLWGTPVHDHAPFGSAHMAPTQVP